MGEGLAAEIVAAGALNEFDASHIRGWSEREHVLLEFQTAGLVSAEQWMSSFASGAAALLRSADIDPAFAEEGRGVVSALVPTLTEATTGLLEDLDNAALESPWLDGTRRLALRSQLAASRRAAGESVGFPFSTDELNEACDNATELTEGDVEAALGSWLRAFAPDVSESWKVLDRFAGCEPIPAALLPGLNGYAAGLRKRVRSDLVGLALKGFPDESPSDSFLSTVLFPDSDLDASAQLIVDAFESAQDDRARERVMGLWGTLKLTNREVSRQLLKGVMTPLISQGPLGRQLVLANLHLVGVLVNEDKRSLAQALQAAAADASERAQIESRLVEAGFMKRGMFSGPRHL